MEKDRITVEEALKCFCEDADPEAEKRLSGCDLFQEAIRITMEMNTRYHTPEELRELMSQLTGKIVDDTFRLFPPFTADFGKNITIGKNVFINSARTTMRRSP